MYQLPSGILRVQPAQEEEAGVCIPCSLQQADTLFRLPYSSLRLLCPAGGAYRPPRVQPFQQGQARGSLHQARSRGEAAEESLRYHHRRHWYQPHHRQLLQGPGTAPMGSPMYLSNAPIGHLVCQHLLLPCDSQRSLNSCCQSPCLQSSEAMGHVTQRFLDLLAQICRPQLSHDLD